MLLLAKRRARADHHYTETKVYIYNESVDINEKKILDNLNHGQEDDN